LKLNQFDLKAIYDSWIQMVDSNGDKLPTEIQLVISIEQS
jgi:hypothetical protein